MAMWHFMLSIGIDIYHWIVFCFVFFLSIKINGYFTGHLEWVNCPACAWETLGFFFNPLLTQTNTHSLLLLFQGVQTECSASLRLPQEREIALPVSGH